LTTKKPPPRLRVKRSLLSEHPSVYPVFDMTEELRRRGFQVDDRTWLGDVAGRLATRAGLSRHLITLPTVYELRPMMGMQPWHMFPSVLWRPSILLCWDVWEPDYAAWTRLFQRMSPAAIFMTAAQSVEHFRSQLPDVRVEWLPEATDPSWYLGGPILGQRRTFLEMGRRYTKLHDTVIGVPESRGFQHVFAQEEAVLAFRDRAAMAAGLSAAIVSVCLPSSSTHPERSGGVETMTHRYLETMAAGCIPWGHAPEELCRLFEYNPVLEIDWGDPASQLDAILADPAKYQDLVDRNRLRLLETSTWEIRVSTLLRRLDRLGLNVGRT